MRLRNLKWLGLLGPLGLLGFYQPMLSVLSGFWAFLVLFGADERTEANLGRAAAISYAVTLTALVVSFLIVGVSTNRHASPGDMLQLLGLLLAITYIAHVASLIGTYVYLEWSGR